MTHKPPTRTVHIFKDNKWIEVPFEELKVGDIYEMFESTGEPVLNDDGSSLSIVIKAPYIQNGVLTIQDEPYNDKKRR